MNILYLENHAVFAEQVTRQFLAAHCVLAVPSLAAARSSLASGDFDLVLSDYDLDDGKGEEFVRECRAAHPLLPIIVVSSHDAGNAVLVAAGASVVCSKMEFDRIQKVIGGFEHERWVTIWWQVAARHGQVGRSTRMRPTRTKRIVPA